MRKELGLLNCKKHTKHSRKRPKNREVSEQKNTEQTSSSQLTEKDGYVPMIDIIDVAEQ